MAQTGNAQSTNYANHTKGATVKTKTQSTKGKGNSGAETKGKAKPGQTKAVLPGNDRATLLALAKQGGIKAESPIAKMFDAVGDNVVDLLDKAATLAKTHGAACYTVQAMVSTFEIADWQGTGYTIGDSASPIRSASQWVQAFRGLTGERASDEARAYLEFIRRGATRHAAAESLRTGTPVKVPSKPGKGGAKRPESEQGKVGRITFVPTTGNRSPVTLSPDVLKENEGAARAIVTALLGPQQAQQGGALLVVDGQPRPFSPVWTVEQTNALWSAIGEAGFAAGIDAFKAMLKAHKAAKAA